MENSTFLEPVVLDGNQEGWGWFFVVFVSLRHGNVANSICFGRYRRREVRDGSGNRNCNFFQVFASVHAAAKEMENFIQIVFGVEINRAALDGSSCGARMRDLACNGV